MWNVLRGRVLPLIMFIAPTLAMFPFGPGMFGPGFPFGGGANFGDHIRNNIGNMMAGMEQQNAAFHHEMNNWQMNLNQQMDEVRQSTQVIGILGAMSRGVGGTTIARYNGRVVVVRDGNSFTCQGDLITPSNPNQKVKCTGALIPALKDACTPGGTRMSMDGKVCIGENLIMSSFNGNVECKNGQLYDYDELRQMCGPAYGTPNYIKCTYYPDPNSRNAINFSNNKYLPCGQSNWSCTWTSDESGL